MKARRTAPPYAEQGGGSSVGQSSGLIIRRSVVRVHPAPPPFPQVRGHVGSVGDDVVPWPGPHRPQDVEQRCAKLGYWDHLVAGRLDQIASALSGRDSGRRDQ